MHFKLGSSWEELLREEFQKPYYKELLKFLVEERNNYEIFPPEPLLFDAFRNCSYSDVRVVIIGQDPYHGEGQANGLCFSVSDGMRIPPSLKNIFKELKNDLGIEMPTSGNLQRWAKQGVLLLNATLTVRANAPGTHQKKGWETFTDAVIEKLSNEKEDLVFILWGAYAQKKGSIINDQKHLVLKAAHPSPFAVERGFFGCRHFSKTNSFLVSKGKDSIQW
jgi:uracil-DNA glycosylase